MLCGAKRGFAWVEVSLNCEALGDCETRGAASRAAGRGNGDFSRLCSTGHGGGDLSIGVHLKACGVDSSKAYARCSCEALTVNGHLRFRRTARG